MPLVKVVYSLKSSAISGNETHISELAPYYKQYFFNRQKAPTVPRRVACWLSPSPPYVNNNNSNLTRKWLGHRFQLRVAVLLVIRFMCLSVYLSVFFLSVSVCLSWTSPTPVCPMDCANDFNFSTGYSTLL